MTMPAAAVLLREFVAGVRVRLAALIDAANKQQQLPPACLVLGNVSADLDSVASALSLAYAMHLDQHHKSADDTTDDATDASHPQTVMIPVLNVRRDDLPLRLEVMFMLKKIELDPQDLVCIDDIDLELLSTVYSAEAPISPTNSRFSVVLVDHNELATHQQCLSGYVKRVIDHHKDMQLFSRDAVQSEIKAIGSCSSLIANQPELEFAMATDPSVSELLLSAILIDTVCLDASKGRTFDEDIAAAERLQQYSRIDRDELFRAVQAAKFDCQHLTTAQLMRKDYKSVQVGNVVVGLPAITLSFAQLCQRAGYVADLATFCENQGTALLVIMGTVSTPDFQRELSLFALEATRASAWYPAVEEALLEKSTLQLSPILPDETTDSFKPFAQGDVTKSRKFVLPFVRSSLEEALAATTTTTAAE